jgi:hypothetical protein
MQAAGGTLDDVVKTTIYLMQGMDRNVFLARIMHEGEI